MQIVKPAARMLFGTVEKTGPTSKSGLYVPDSAKQKIAISTIIAVGSDVEAYKPGMVVLFKEYTQHDIKLEDGDYILLELDDVLGELVVEKDAADGKKD